MKEIVTLQLGACGNAMGYRFWEDVCQEHGVTPGGSWCGDHSVQIEKISCLFNAGATDNFVPRSILVDLDYTTLDNCRTLPYGGIFYPDNMLFFMGGNGSGAGNNWARGYYELGPTVVDSVMDKVRLEVEKCDWLTGFQMVNSLGGGTGSSLQSLLIPMMHQEYTKQVMVNFAVVPSPKFSDIVVEPYNALLSLPSLVDHSDITVCLDNENLYDISTKALMLTKPGYDDINFLTAKVMSGISATYRFPARCHCSWRVLKCLNPSPRLHFYIPGYVPLLSRGVLAYARVNLRAITHEMLHGRILLAPLDKVSGKYLNAAALFRGYPVHDLNVDDLLSQYEFKNPSHFAQWMPYHFMKGICITPPVGPNVSSTFLANHTSSTKIWKRVYDRYKKLIKRNAFLHWYTAEGMTMDDFREAEDKMLNLLQEYKAAEISAPSEWISPEDNLELKKILEEEEVLLEQPPRLMKLELEC